LVENGGKDAYFEATSVPKDTHELYEALKANLKLPRTIIQRKGEPFPSPREPFELLEPFGKSYKPLIATPYLFLEFARIVERKDPEQAVHDWISKYGLLGLQRREPHKFDMSMGGGPAGAAFEKEYSQRGGEQETLARYLSEASQANRILACYEAILSKDIKKLEQIAFEEEMFGEDLDEHLQLQAAVTGGDYADVLIDWILLVHIIEDIQEALKEFTFPCIAHRQSVDRNYRIGTIDFSVKGSHGLPKSNSRNTLWAPDRLVRSLYPRNLLGAMYLQFYWLITSAAELARCKECGRIIPHAAPMPGSGRTRKTHKNKEFCNDRCRQRYHYHNRVKPNRNGTRDSKNA
jgi:hypothetical protein